MRTASTGTVSCVFYKISIVIQDHRIVVDPILPAILIFEVYVLLSIFFDTTYMVFFYFYMDLQYVIIKLKILDC